MRVAVRVRPDQTAESSCIFLDRDKNSIRLNGPKADQSTPRKQKSQVATPVKHKLFHFDKCFDEGSPFLNMIR